MPGRAALHQEMIQNASVRDHGPMRNDLRRLVGQGSLVGQARVVRNLRRTSHTRKCQQIRWPLDSQMPEKGDGINNAANLSSER